ncbi:hypothetical protein IMZ48_32395 [Candidatus Bathyarchaeota archaeon]|nr:hypothetical protein [Candidatus Bathyarchaeota archaeon]
MMSVSLSWYTTTPVGRVINRFSRDISCLDDRLAGTLESVVRMTIGLLFRLGSVGMILPVFVVPSVATCVVGFIMGEMYTRTGVILRRLESSSLSPVFSQFTDTMAGLAVIRSRGSVPDKFGDLLADRLALWSTTAEALYNANRWVGMRIGFIASLMTLSAGLIALAKSDTIASGLVGFSLLHATTISTSILSVVRGVNDLEIELQSVRFPGLAGLSSAFADETSSLTASKSTCPWIMRRSLTMRFRKRGMTVMMTRLLGTASLGTGRAKGRLSFGMSLFATTRTARTSFPTSTSPSGLASVLRLWAGLARGRAL